MAAAAWRNPANSPGALFLNGRLDLAQAEAVADFDSLAHGTCARARPTNSSPANFPTHQRAARRDDEDASAHVEAHIDFPDEDIAAGNPRANSSSASENGVAFMSELMRTANEGQDSPARHPHGDCGSSDAEANQSAQSTARPRTAPSSRTSPARTRARLRRRRTPWIARVFIDTAGLREARDEIEVEGIRRSRESLAKAELICTSSTPANRSRLR